MSNIYAGLKRDFAQDVAGLNRCAARLLEMRRQLSELKARGNSGNLLLATWNIRDFDSNKFGFGPRLAESFYYIAEVISCFDLVAVQEVGRDLRPLERVMKILGRSWEYIATDVTAGTSGNGERMAFLYNKEKVFFRRVAGEVVLPKGQMIVTEQTEEKSGQQFARSPFLVAFQSGWFRFSLCTVHIYYGKDNGPQLQQRIDEIRSLVHFFAQRQDSASSQEKDAYGAVENYILLGDFNVVSPEHQTMAALKQEEFVVPEAIDGRAVRQKGQHFYDQIAVRVKDERFEVVGGGLLDLYSMVFRNEDLETYRAFMPDKDTEGTAKTESALYEKWRTWQMSDHHPLWIEIRTDFSDDYLTKLSKP